jgi:hypothetical protein
MTVRDKPKGRMCDTRYHRGNECRTVAAGLACSLLMLRLETKGQGFLLYDRLNPMWFVASSINHLWFN